MPLGVLRGNDGKWLGFEGKKHVHFHIFPMDYMGIVGQLCLLLVFLLNAVYVSHVVSFHSRF